MYQIKVKLRDSAKVYSLELFLKLTHLVTFCLFWETGQRCLLIPDKIMHFVT